ncbi:MICOS complex subunit MIC27, partial [Galemys pyrenaicus]
NPPQYFLSQIGVITVSGVAGLVSKTKGSRFKKMTYLLGLTTFGASVCYLVVSNNCKELGTEKTPNHNPLPAPRLDFLSYSSCMIPNSWIMAVTSKR